MKIFWRGFWNIKCDALAVDRQCDLYPACPKSTASTKLMEQIFGWLKESVVYRYLYLINDHDQLLDIQ